MHRPHPLRKPRDVAYPLAPRRWLCYPTPRWL